MDAVTGHLKRNWRRYLLAAVAAYGAAHGIDPEISSSIANKAIEVIAPAVGQ